MIVTIIEKPKEGKKYRRSENLSKERAESALRRSKNWMLPENSKYQFKDGEITLKPEKKTRAKKTTS